MRPQTPPEKLTPNADIPVRPPRTGVNTTSGVLGLTVKEVVILEVRIGIATHTCGAGGGRLQANGLAAAIQDEVASGENGCMTPHAADPRAEHSKGLLGRLVVVAIHVGYRTAARNKRVNIAESSRQLSETADAEPKNRALFFGSAYVPAGKA